MTLHHVRPASKASFDPNALLAVTPEFLDRLLGHLRSRNWRFVSVDELVGDSAGGPRRIAVTLDDGYRNNMEHAWPVFRKNAAPFTIYVCPGFTERKSELWWEALERMIRAADRFPTPGAEPPEMMPTRTPTEKAEAYNAWRNWLTTAVDEFHQRETVRALARDHDLDLTELARELVMDWDEVRKIASDPLCTIGAHTMTHPALARLPADSAHAEMLGSVETIAERIGKRPTSLAFPYGYPAAAGLREAALAEKAGLTASFTTQPGYVTSQGSRHGLPRVSINGLFQEPRFLDVLLSPGLWQFRNKIRALR